jgi:hypothetical protein
VNKSHLCNIALTLVLIIAMPGAAKAACSNPTGAEGDLIYNSTHHMMQFCDDTDWIAMAGTSSCSTPPSGPTASDGYFVLAANATDGSMGGLAGANAICLTELTNSDWKNKATAIANGQLVAGKVRAFLCDGTTCQNGQPNTTYYFASTYDVDTGGATMTTDASGYGPGDNEMWATVSRFGSNDTGASSGFWTGRAASGWATWPNSSHASRCTGWTSTSGNGGPGQIQFYDGGSGRWARSWVEGCGSVLHLVCFVDP